MRYNIKYVALMVLIVAIASCKLDRAKVRSASEEFRLLIQSHEDRKAYDEEV